MPEKRGNVYYQSALMLIDTLIFAKELKRNNIQINQPLHTL